MKNEKLKERIEEVLIILALMVAVLVVPLTGGTSSLFLYISAILFVAFNVITDICYASVDPRVRLE